MHQKKCNPKKRRDIRLTGTVYCDWNATFVDISRVPQAEHLAPGDLIVWSWSGDKRAPSSRSHSGVLRVSVVVGVRAMRRANFQVHHLVDRKELSFASDDQRERRLIRLVDELRRLAGRRLKEQRFGYDVFPADANSVAAGCSPLVSQTAPLPPGTLAGVPRGRIKPGIRSEPPEPVTTAPAPTCRSSSTSKRRRARRQQFDPRQGSLF